MGPDALSGVDDPMTGRAIIRFDGAGPDATMEPTRVHTNVSFLKCKVSSLKCKVLLRLQTLHFKLLSSGVRRL